MAEARLKGAGVDTPALDARLLAAHALGADRATLLVRGQETPSPDIEAAFAALIARRERREPVGRILGAREFYGLPFHLNEATLEPRPDSETLIDAALERMTARRHEPLTLLDLGTGTGCLLLALLHALPKARGVGLDIAPRAVEQATANAARLGLETRATFVVGDWVERLAIEAKPLSFPRYDLIISNPPYIATDELNALMPEVLNHDPAMALDGGADGLCAYRALMAILPRLIAPEGLVMLEVGAGQAQEVARLLATAGFTDIATHRDLGGIERAVSGRGTPRDAIEPIFSKHGPTGRNI